MLRSVSRDGSRPILCGAVLTKAKLEGPYLQAPPCPMARSTRTRSKALIDTIGSKRVFIGGLVSKRETLSRGNQYSSDLEAAPIGA
jgi:hypothetical protein